MATIDPLSELSRMAGSSVPGVGGGGLGSLPRNRSFKELRAASESLGSGHGAAGGSTTTILPSQQQQTANPFLSNLPTLRSTSSAAAPQPASGEQTKAATTPEERIDEHVQNLFTKYAQMEQDETRRVVDAMYEKRAQEAHDARMKRYVAELHGNRTLGGSSKVLLPSTTTPSVMTTMNTQDLDPATVADYLKIVYQWNRSRQEPLDNVLAAFQNLPRMSAATAGAWRLLAAIIARNEVGALSFFCHQFQQIVKDRVRQATVSGQDVSTPFSLSHGMAQVVGSYVKLTTNNTASSWPIVYYCLRCGDAAAALQVLDATNAQADPAVRQMVSSLSQTQGSLSCVWDAPVPPAVSSSIRRAVAALYDRTKHLDSTDPYHVATLALLGATDLDSVLGSPVVVKTTEDYLFGGLWYARQQDYPPTAIQQLANNVKTLGASSFPNDSEWGYALPLMAVQQYREALTEVALTNLLQATHMAMMLDAANVDLREGTGSTPAASTLVTTLLVEYANKLQQKDEFAAAEYLVRIPNDRKAQQEVARIVVESSQPNEFISCLPELFLDAAASVLVASAEQARNRGHAALAAHLFWKADRFDLLLSLLNDQLASEMAGGVERIDWWNKALTFQNEDLVDGKDLMIKSVLEETNTTDRLETFETLMKLDQAFLHAKAKDYERAWACIDMLPLLPKSEGECSTKARQYASLDPAIKQVFPMLLEKSMEALSQIYSQLKSASYGQSAAQQLERVRSRAQMLFFDFTSLLQSEIPAGTTARMAAIEKSMI